MRERADYLVQLLADTILALVRREGADLSARQIAVLLICYLDNLFGVRAYETAGMD